MKKPYRKIIPLLIIIILVPTIILSLYQISSLNQSEKNIEKIYTSELTTILGSINEYVGDYISDWARETNLFVLESRNGNDVTFKEYVKKFLIQSRSINMLVTSDINVTKDPQIISNNPDTLPINIRENIKNILKNNYSKIKTLIEQKRSGIRNIVAIKNNLIGNNVLIIFLLQLPEEKNEICGFLINPENFIRRNLSWKLKSITGNEFVVAVSDQNNIRIFSTGEDSSATIEQQANINFLPGYTVNILLKGVTISSLVKERSIRNLILISLINLFLIIGLWFVLKNFRKETELSNQQTNFVANVSHELRTPLSLINLFSETLVMGRVKEREKELEYFKIINDESNRLSRIVEKILRFRSIEENKEKYSFTDENLNSLIENVLQAYGYQIENSNFKIKFEAHANLPDIQIDKEAVIEVVINLLDNAMKYSKYRKEIIVATGLEKEFVYLKVKDFGLGISSANQKKIFEKFYRVQDGLAKDKKGTGLGLTIVKSIMDAHQGRIEVESSEGKGSCFTLKFRNGNA